MDKLQESYKLCDEITRNHYENFPVASYFLPKDIQAAITTIYAFARTADDIADEPHPHFNTASHKLEKLEEIQEQLNNLDKIDDKYPLFFYALKDTILRYELPLSLFNDLLEAFKKDVIKTRYNTIDELFLYCRYSANPIGRLLLYLTDNYSAENAKKSDAICTALQLINFLQDLYFDLLKLDRCYLPLDELKKYSLSLEDIKDIQNFSNLEPVIKKMIVKVHNLLVEGQNLPEEITGGLSMQIKIVITSAFKVLEKLDTRKSITQDTRIRWKDWIKILYEAAVSDKKKMIEVADAS